MTILEKINTLERIHMLISMKSTGAPKELANRLEMSERALYKTLDLMKQMGGPIAYNSRRQS